MYANHLDEGARVVYVRAAEDDVEALRRERRLRRLPVELVDGGALLVRHAADAEDDDVAQV